MIKDKLMKAVKAAAADYNSGSDANSSVAAAAKAADFNEKQTDRLVEMFNTLAALNKEKDKDDPTGSCELASKKEVAKMLLGDSGSEKKAYAIDNDYSFYLGEPVKTNGAIEARKTGRSEMLKAASCDHVIDDPVLGLSQGSLYKVIDGKIRLLKSAADAADEVVRNLKLEIDKEAVKVAKAIEASPAGSDVADLFKAACQSMNAVDRISEYSTRLAASNGGRFSKMQVFDASPVEDLLKSAEEIERHMASIPEYESRRDMYMSKASEFEDDMFSAVGLPRMNEKKAECNSLADMFSPGSVSFRHEQEDDNGKQIDEDGAYTKIAELISKSGIPSEEVEKAAESLEKAAVPLTMPIPSLIPSMSDAMSAMSSDSAVTNGNQIINNTRRSIILADLMSNDPIIRDADPNQVVETYKAMVMTSPRVSLDKAQVRSFLRSAINSVAVSPADAKVIADVDRGVALSNLEKLTSLDSSIKDSNKA